MTKSRTIFQRTVFGESEVVGRLKDTGDEIPFVLPGDEQAGDPRGWRHVLTVSRGTTLYTAHPATREAMVIGCAKDKMLVGPLTPPSVRDNIVGYHVQVLNDDGYQQPGDNFWIGKRRNCAGWMR